MDAIPPKSSHTVTNPFHPVDTTRLLSPLSFTACTRLVTSSTCGVVISFSMTPLAKFHNRTLPSEEPVINRRPPTSKHAHVSLFRLCGAMSSSSPSSTARSATIGRYESVSRSSSSGRRVPSAPSNLNDIFPVNASQIRTPPESSQDTIW